MKVTTDRIVDMIIYKANTFFYWAEYILCLCFTLHLPQILVEEHAGNNFFCWYWFYRPSRSNLRFHCRVFVICLFTFIYLLFFVVVLFELCLCRYWYCMFYRFNDELWLYNLFWWLSLLVYLLHDHQDRLYDVAFIWRPMIG